MNTSESQKDVDTGTPSLLAKLSGGVFTLTLNRPDVLNALNGEMVSALSAQLAWADLDASVRCVVLTGAGKAFCPGGDLKDASRLPGESEPPLVEQIEVQQFRQRATAGRLFAMSKPTLAVLPGAAAGAGMALALACDLRIMSHSAFFITAFAKVGFSGDFGGTYFLSQLIGSAKAKELYFLSERVDAGAALSLGLTNWICEPQDLEARASEVAIRLAQGPSIAYRYMKENLNRALTGDVVSCLDLEATHHVHCSLTVDHQEAVKAFLDKRKPVFAGR